MAKLKINDKGKKPDSEAKWKKLKHDGTNLDCLHCKYTTAEESIPTEEFESHYPDGSTKTIKEIKVVRGKHDDAIGWIY